MDKSQLLLQKESRSKILLVDDLQENLLVLLEILKDLDVEFITADSGNEALKLVLKEKIALILMDVQMPEMNGYEAAELIRSLHATQMIPIIFVTAINKERTHVFKGYEAGAVDYMFKPLDPFVLRSKVKIFLDMAAQQEMLKYEISERKRTEAEKEHLIAELTEALKNVKTLSGLLPICASCKKIRDDKGYWEQIESYIHKRSDAKFSHSLCPDCLTELYPDLDEEIF
jgi:CheY-like chemotaxis protein